jgi:hypothetical protein
MTSQRNLLRPFISILFFCSLFGEQRTSVCEIMRGLGVCIYIVSQVADVQVHVIHGPNIHHIFLSCNTGRGDSYIFLNGDYSIVHSSRNAGHSTAERGRTAQLGTQLWDLICRAFVLPDFLHMYVVNAWFLLFLAEKRRQMFRFFS